MTANGDGAEGEIGEAGRKRWIGLVLGPAAFVTLLVLPTGMEPLAARTAAVAALMAIWWMMEALPLPATALLPVALFPILGVMSPADAAAPYANPVIFLFLGGFLLALAMERWGLHRRIALALVAAVGTGPRRLIAGFMAATAFLSMWISNTATAAMMLPIGLAIAGLMEADPGDRRDGAPPRPGFATALMLGIAYAATIGGMATLIGTPPNAVFAAAASEILGRDIGFTEWMAVGLPLSLILLPAAWALLVVVHRPPRRLGPEADQVLAAERAALGPMDRGEKMTLAIFGLTAAAWLMRQPKVIAGVEIPGLSSLAPGIDDSTIAIVAAILLFAVPVRPREGQFVLDWASTARLPWGVLLLFGGGLSLAAAFEVGGLTAIIAAAVTGLAGVPGWVLVMATITVFVALSELASNTAIAALAMPVLAAAAAGMGLDPLVLMAVGALAASAAYMMPVATPPNAIAFGSGHIRMADMMRAGLWMNLLSIVLLTLLARFVIGLALG